MKWKSHVAIARAISRQLQLPPDLEKALCDGSVEPDKRPDAIVGRKNGRWRFGRLPHHAASSNLIMFYVRTSRIAFLNGQDYWALKNLGRALHYVQDRSVSVGAFGLTHDRRESRIGELRPSPLDVQRGLERAVSSPFFVKERLKKLKGRKGPEEAMRQATLVSSAIVGAVLDDSRSQASFLDSYRVVKRRHWFVRLPLAAIILGSSIAAAFLILEPLLVIPGAIASYLSLRFDFDYYRLKEEAMWYGFE